MSNSEIAPNETLQMTFVFFSVPSERVNTTNELACRDGFSGCMSIQFVALVHFTTDIHIRGLNLILNFVFDTRIFHVVMKSVMLALDIMQSLLFAKRF